jgi:hypothetical protein
MKVTLNEEQTAVEWLYDRFLFAGYAVPSEWKEKAKEIENKREKEIQKLKTEIDSLKNQIK